MFCSYARRNASNKQPVCAFMHTVHTRLEAVVLLLRYVDLDPRDTVVS